MSDTLTRDSYEPSGPYGLFVGGEEIAGDAEFAALDPSTGAQWATVAEASVDQRDPAVGAAAGALTGSGRRGGWGSCGGPRTAGGAARRWPPTSRSRPASCATTPGWSAASTARRC